MKGFSAFHKALHKWYQAHGRHDLPWRITRDPYAIYLSEIMLQQTQVKTVLERFYFPFLKRFPTLQALADASLDDVLKRWEGLGYYRRAGNLHEAAKQAAPQLPKTVEGLLTLKGIGQNTAHAVAAFAYHTPVPVLEANVKRVVARIFALKAPTDKEWWEAAWQLLDCRQPFDYNQAMMDLGAMICLPKAPKCADCPAAAICQGKTSPESYPQKVKKKAVPTRRRRLVAFENAKGEWYLEPREGAFLGGLYGFLEYPETTESVAFRNVAYDLERDGSKLGNVQQIYSHFKLDGELWCVPVKDKKSEGFYSAAAIGKLAISGADKKAIELLISK